VAALIATAVDFGTMVLVVELFRRSSVTGTVAGAAAGAVTNFLIGRFWAYRREDAALAGQAFRYALVAAGSLVLNALGEYFLAVRLGLGYVLARTLVAIAVSNLWNFPLQSLVVFGRRRPSGSRDPSP
jgi:putative flippase GtrA